MRKFMIVAGLVIVAFIYMPERFHLKPQRVELSQAELSRTQIVMYSLTTCPYCKALRRTFEANRIPFAEYFVDENPARMQELVTKLQAAGYQGGGIGTPTLEVNGRMMPNNPPFEEIIRQLRA